MCSKKGVMACIMSCLTSVLLSGLLILPNNQEMLKVSESPLSHESRKASLRATCPILACCMCLHQRKKCWSQKMTSSSWNCVLVGIILIAAQGRTWADLWQVSQDHSGVDLHAH